MDPTVGTNNSDIINELLQRFYNKQHARVRAAGMKPMVWEEVPLNYNVSIGSDVVVQTWLSAGSVKTVTSLGNRVIDSGYDYWVSISHIHFVFLYAQTSTKNFLSTLTAAAVTF